MMRYFLLTFFSAAILSVAAQNKLNPAGQIIFEKYNTSRFGKNTPASDNHIDGKTQLAIIVLKSPESVSALEMPGIEITSDLGGIVIAKIDLDILQAIEALPDVTAISFGDRMEPDMNYARPSGNTTSVQDGFSYNGIQTSFDGSGVVCGIMDIGLDANHINFKNSDGSSRIKKLWEMHYNTSNGNVTYDEYTPDNISSFTTDDNTTSHATHVAGIMAGSYNSTGTYAYMSTNQSKSPVETNGNIPYYGVATGADLALSVGELYSPNILQGISNIIGYAESVGKPAVINLSLGHTYGPHDGTDAYSQALAILGKKAIICMSSGNDGDIPMSITKTFTDTDLTMKTQLLNNTGSGILDIWSDNNESMNVKWALYDLSTQTFTDLAELTGTGQQTTLNTSNANFAKFFTGDITMYSNVNTSNNRYNVYCEVNVAPLSSNSSVYLALIVNGHAGQTAYIYGGTKVSFTSQSLTGWTDGSKANSINDGACADNVISVGSYTTRTTWGLLKTGYYKSYDATYKINKISPFSSYGTSFHGKQLPLVCGPGAAIISSYNKYYVNRVNGADDMTAKATVNGVVNYWGSMQGTSMSCPYVTGTIGLWLQADPSLTFDKVVEVIDNTSSYNKISNGTPAAAWGAGKIDALEGIKYVLANKAAIGTVWADEAQRLVITSSAGGYDVFVADGRDITVTLYDLQGRPAARVQGSDGAATLSADGLPHGVYIIEARGDGYRFSRKVTR